MARVIDPQDYEGTQRVRIVASIVAGGKPRAVGEIVELPTHECVELISAGLAEPLVAGPRLVSGL